MVYFFSDAHLGAGYIDNPLQQERIIATWLDSISSDADELYLLGDVMDYWFEYRNVVPRGHVRVLGALARLADKGVKITWLKGNHDIWMTDYLSSEIGCKIVDGVLDTMIYGNRFVMEHGDGVGNKPLSFRILRHIFRNKPARLLYAAIHPRWTNGFAHAWSAHSRKKGGYSGGNQAIGHIAQWAKEYEETHGKVDHFIFGHLHFPHQEILPSGATFTILGDAFKKMSYARFDGEKLTLKTMSEI
ncbi:MAG: UDP-2,3-diacylglucosamine diphosphatase [Pseudoflavonifractor sp.]|nr:UDP-2,3-diacylglucosamine diphosphatase [Pseudoflavonifractor sp.]